VLTTCLYGKKPTLTVNYSPERQAGRALPCAAMVEKQQHIDYSKSNVLNVTSAAIFAAGHRPWQTVKVK